MSLAGSCFSTESAPGPFHHGIRGRGGTILSAALPSEARQDQADSRTHLIHRPARDIFPLLGGTLLGGLAVRRTAGPSGLTNSPHPSSREGHLSTAGWNSGFLLSGLILNGFHAAAAACSRVHRNSVPSTQMRCMITASRRARATIAFFIPRRLAICMAHALSQHHFFECI